MVNKKKYKILLKKYLNFDKHYSTIYVYRYAYHSENSGCFSYASVPCVQKAETSLRGVGKQTRLRKQDITQKTAVEMIYTAVFDIYSIMLFHIPLSMPWVKC